MNGTITITGKEADQAAISKINKKIINAKYIHVLMPTYNLIKCSNNYSKTGRLWQYHRYESQATLFGSESLKWKVKKQEITQLMVI